MYQKSQCKHALIRKKHLMLQKYLSKLIKNSLLHKTKPEITEDNKQLLAQPII